MAQILIWQEATETNLRIPDCGYERFHVIARRVPGHLNMLAGRKGVAKVLDI